MSDPYHQQKQEEYQTEDYQKQEQTKLIIEKTIKSIRNIRLMLKRRMKQFGKVNKLPRNLFPMLQVKVTL